MLSDRGQPSWQRQVISDGRKNMISPGVKIGDRDVAFALGNHVPKTLKQKLLQHSVCARDREFDTSVQRYTSAWDFQGWCSVCTI